MGAMTVIAGYNQTDYINVTLVRETVQPIINVLNSSLAAQLPPVDKYVKYRIEMKRGRPLNC